MSTLLDRERFRRDHRWAPGRMSDYLDGELAPAQRARMEHHLGECAGCRRLLAGLRQTVAALHRLAAPDDAVDTLAIVTSVRSRLDERD
ncbi:MAG TPA: zf-HC2 domain-containing protein [Solirubrobacteraceae bacterium]|nr:zf-HC2 domain-containing protein [Solirubrobacteraceae bacterium]